MTCSRISCGNLAGISLSPRRGGPGRRQIRETRRVRTYRVSSTLNGAFLVQRAVLYYGQGLKSSLVGARVQTPFWTPNQRAHQKQRSSSMGSNASSNLFSRVGPLGLLHLPALDLPPFLLPDRTAEQPDLLRLEPAACFES